MEPVKSANLWTMPAVDNTANIKGVRPVIGCEVYERDSGKLIGRVRDLQFPGEELKGTPAYRR